MNLSTPIFSWGRGFWAVLWGGLQSLALGLGLMLKMMISAATTVIIPDQIGRPGTSVSFPVEIESDDSLYGIQFDVRYDANQLIASLATPEPDLAGDVMLKSSFIASGHQRVAIYSQGSQPLPSRSLARLHFSIPSDIPVEPSVVQIEGVGVAGGDGGVLEGVGQSGTLSIVVVPDVVTISGRVLYYSNEAPMPEVSLRVRGAESVTGISDGEGSFSVSVPSESPLEMRAELFSEPIPNRGVTSLDLLLTRRHILGVAPFADPFQLLAADVDRQGDVGALDLLLMRRLILGLAPEFISEQALFRFVASEAFFQDPLMPWDVSGSISYPGLDADVGGQNFQGLKLGDVDGDWVSAFAGSAEQDDLPMRMVSRSVSRERRSEPVRLGLHTLSENPQSRIRSLIVDASPLEAVEALQFSLGWDTEKIELIAVHPAQLPGLSEEHFGLHPSLAAQGRLSFAWNVAPTEQGLTQEKLELFRVDYSQKSGSEGGFSLRSDPTPSLAFRRGHRVALVELPLATNGINVVGNPNSDEPRSLPLNLSVFGQNFHVRSFVESRPDWVYHFEYSETWPAREWSRLASRQGDGELLSFRDRIREEGQRFYRIRGVEQRSDFENVSGSQNPIREEVE